MAPRDPHPDIELLSDFAKLSASTSARYFTGINRALGADAKRCLEKCIELKDSDDAAEPLSAAAYEELGFWYRALLRALMSYVEGILYVLREVTVWSYDRGEIELGAAEVALLKEVEYTFNLKRKRAAERQKHNRFLENFVLTFAHAPKVFKAEFEVDYGNYGWERFQRAVQYRHDITHPKNLEHALLAPEMPNVIRDASVWFFGIMGDLTKSFDLEFLKADELRVANSPEIKEILRRRKEGRDRDAT